MTKHLTVAAAGTGGHVMPALAVAKVLLARGWTASWIGTEAGMERALVEKAGIAFHALDFQGLRGKGLKTMLFGGFKLLSSIFKSRSLLEADKTDVVFSTGGYVAVPVCLGASLNSVPYVLANSDADPLLSIRMIQGNASGVMCGFEGKAATLAGSKALVSGNPVRAEILSVPLPNTRYEGREGPLKLLVFGGSLGARVFNETIPQALSLIEPDKRPRVTHQCGKNATEEVKKRYEALGIEATVVPFIDDMAQSYADCDLVISRAGAISVSELTAAGVPAVLVPLVTNTTSHQVGNARFMEEKGAAIYLPQEEFSPQSVSSIIQGLDRPRLVEMAQKAKALGRPQAAETVADFLEHLVSTKKR